MDRQLLARATENSDAPTPGYMYLDIAKNAASNPQTCAEIAKYLTGRLASKHNSNIKFKCLKVIAKTAVSPYLKGQFKRCLAQDPQAMAAIKDATQFRGPPDPVRGDEPYEKVRNAAKEALDAVYSDTPAAEQGGGGSSFATSVSSSYGPSSGSGGGGYGGAPPGGRRMEGIGNPMFKDPRLEPQPQGIGNMTVNDIVNEAKSTVIGIIKDPLARNLDIQVTNRQGSMPRPGGSYSGPSSGAVSLTCDTLLTAESFCSLLSADTFFYFIFFCYSITDHHLDVPKLCIKRMESGPWHPIVVLQRSDRHPITPMIRPITNPEIPQTLILGRKVRQAPQRVVLVERGRQLPPRHPICTAIKRHLPLRLTMLVVV
jgi:hypothetical protein